MSINVIVDGLNNDIDITMGATPAPIEADVGEITLVDRETYSGSYEVTPSASQQTLDTDNKVLANDVVVKPIPYFETSNISGITVYIGGN